jgi:hypothetical protein
MVYRGRIEVMMKVFSDQQNVIRIWLSVWGILACLSGCGSEVKPSGRRPSIHGELAAVHDISNNSMAGAAVAAQTETENGRAPGACVDLLMADGKDIFVQIENETDASKVRDVVCAQSEESLVHLLKESHAQRGAKSNQFGLIIDSLSQYGKNMGKLNYNTTTTNDYADHLATIDAHTIRAAMCADQSAETYRKSVVSSFKSIASAVTMDRYNACVMARSYGLRCRVVVNGDQIMAAVRWEPTELVRGFLPTVALKVDGLANVKTTSDIPKTLGVGSGVNIPMEWLEGSKDGIFAATASDRSGQYVFSCQTPITRAPHKKTGRFPSCGIASFNMGRGAVCGVQSYVLARSPNCGPELFVAARRTECGVESYNSRHDCDICGQSGPFGGCKQCSSPLFGVAKYKECRREQFGVERYAECRNVSHGVEEYSSCRHESFGVEEYKECEMEIPW